MSDVRYHAHKCKPVTIGDISNLAWLRVELTQWQGRPGLARSLGQGPPAGLGLFNLKLTILAICSYDMAYDIV
jgi:hypothetical protein